MRDLDPPIGKPRGTYYKGTDCPHCHGISSSRVIDVRDAPEGRRRRHECDKCEGRFTTYEITAEQFERLQRVKVNEVLSL
jgi:transcriptional regulator NrdR family protein